MTNTESISRLHPPAPTPPLSHCSCKLTPVSIINVHKFLALVIFYNADEGVLQFWAQLKNKLVGCVDREAGCYKADMESPAEGCEHVDSPPLIEAKDSIDTLGEL